MPFRFIGGVTLTQLLKYHPYFLLDTLDSPVTNGASEYNSLHNTPYYSAAGAIEDAHWSDTHGNHCIFFPVGLAYLTIDEVHIWITNPPGAGATWNFWIQRAGGVQVSPTYQITGGAFTYDATDQNLVLSPSTGLVWGARASAGVPPATGRIRMLLLWHVT